MESEHEHEQLVESDDLKTSEPLLDSRTKRVVGSIIGCEFCERLAYYGILSSLELFMKREMGLATGSAASYLSIWIGFCYVSPLFAGYFADVKWGRFTTIMHSVRLYECGLIGIFISALFLENGIDGGFKTFILIVFWISLFTVAFGTGGIKSCVGPFGAEQIDSRLDGAKELQDSFWNWFYFGINCGSAISYTFIAYLCQDVLFSVGYALPVFALAVGIWVFWRSKSEYVSLPPQGSILARFIQCSRHAWNRRHIRKQMLEQAMAAHLDSLSQSDPSGAVEERRDSSNAIDENLPTHWCDIAKESLGGDFEDTFVTDVKLVYRCLPFNLFFIMYWCIYNEQSTLFYAQGCQMDISMGSFNIPIASLSLVDIFIILLLIPIVDKGIYPYLREKRGMRVTTLQRIGLGFIVATLAMVVAGFIEMGRQSANVTGDVSTCDDSSSVSTMSVFWQIPQYLLIGVSEVLASISGLEFFYAEAPDSMKSIVFAFYLLSTGVGSWLGSLMIWIVNQFNPKWIPNDLNDGYMQYFFFLLAAMMLLSMIVFVPMAKQYRYKSDVQPSYTRLPIDETVTELEPLTGV